ncbi:hypothetical protein [Alkalimarinus coralli]|uniref:hypothetical protein n=1 Tax=Alkalimarinus coralli TaxID=2935863 RepID=UPI00202B4891|nr:hypothetical protein [Alkalimarinus coralli]
MGYVKEKLTPENCIRIQNDLANELPTVMPELWQNKSHIRGPKPGVPQDYETPFGYISTNDPWVIDRERNYYAAWVVYVFEVKRILLFLDGEIYLLETEVKSRVLKPLQIEDISKRDRVKEEAKAAIKVLLRGGYYFKEDKQWIT